MAKANVTPKDSLIEGKSREDIMEAIGKYSADHPDAQIGVVQYDAKKENPFWAEILKA